MARDRAGATRWKRAGLSLGALTLLAGCEGADFAPFGRSGVAATPDSLTVRRVMGQEVEETPLLPEPGNVWPSAEAPRATLANPDGADPALNQRERPRAPLNRRSSLTPPGVLEPLDPVPLPRQGVPPGAAPTPPARGVEGRVIPIPGGPPGVVSSGNDRIQTYTQPGVGTGTAINQGNTTTLIGPDGRVTVVPR